MYILHCYYLFIVFAVKTIDHVYNSLRSLQFQPAYFLKIVPNQSFFQIPTGVALLVAILRMSARPLIVSNLQANRSTCFSNRLVSFLPIDWTYLHSAMLLVTLPCITIEARANRSDYRKNSQDQQVFRHRLVCVGNANFLCSMKNFWCLERLLDGISNGVAIN